MKSIAIKIFILFPLVHIYTCVSAEVGYTDICPTSSTNNVVVARSSSCFCLIRELPYDGRVIIWKFKDANSQTSHLVYDGYGLSNASIADGWYIPNLTDPKVSVLCNFKVSQKLAGTYEAYPSRADVKRISVAVIVNDTTSIELVTGSDAASRRLEQTSSPVHLERDALVRITRIIEYATPSTDCFLHLDWIVEDGRADRNYRRYYSIEDSRDGHHKVESRFSASSGDILDGSRYNSNSFFKCPDFNYSSITNSPMFKKYVEKDGDKVTSSAATPMTSSSWEKISTKAIIEAKTTREIPKNGITQPPVIGESVNDIYFRTLTLAFSIMFPFFIVTMAIIIIIIVAMHRRRQAKKRRGSQGNHCTVSRNIRPPLAVLPYRKVLDDDVSLQVAASPQNEYTRSLIHLAPDPSTLCPASIYDRINEDEIDVPIYNNQADPQPLSPLLQKTSPAYTALTASSKFNYVAAATDGGSSNEASKIPVAPATSVFPPPLRATKEANANGAGVASEIPVAMATTLAMSNCLATALATDSLEDGTFSKEARKSEMVQPDLEYLLPIGLR